MFIVFLRLCAIFLMIGLGWLARRRGIVDGATTDRLSRLLVGLVYPALIFSSMVERFSLESLSEKWLLPVGAFGIMATGFVVGLILLPWFGGRNSPSGRAFHFQATINNYSFLVMPLALFYWGQEGLANVIFSTLGSELAMWSLGVWAISRARLSRESIRQLLTPPILAIVVALLVIVLRDTLPMDWSSDGGGVFNALWGSLIEGLSLFGGATIPLAMVVAGSRIADLQSHHVVHLGQLRLVLVRLVLVPGLAMIWILWLPIPAEVARVLLLIAVMPSAVSSVVVSQIFGGDVDAAAASVLLTHLFCLVTIPFWLALVLRII